MVQTIPANTHVRQTAGATRLNLYMFIMILADGDLLQVIAAVERTIDSPIVRNTDNLPTAVIITDLLGTNLLALDETPTGT